MDRERKGVSPDLGSALDRGQRWIKLPKREKSQHMGGVVKRRKFCLHPTLHNIKRDEIASSYL